MIVIIATTAIIAYMVATSVIIAYIVAISAMIAIQAIVDTTATIQVTIPATTAFMYPMAIMETVFIGINMIICMIGTTELLLIGGLVLLLFGGKKLPELMKGMGQGVRSFKQGLSDPGKDEKPVVDNEVKLPEENTSEKE